MKALLLSGTLKPKGTFSNTEVLSQLLIEKLSTNGVSSEVVRLGDYHIPPGTRSNMGAGDDWPQILQKIFAADILVFVTPVWWGGHSSLMQRAIERLDELNDEIINTGKSELLNKVGGMVITGAEDGVEHIIGTLSNFMIWNGLVLPPACSLSYLGNGEDTPEKLLAKFNSQSYTTGMATTMARNLVHMATLLKTNPIPTAEKGSQSLR